MIQIIGGEGGSGGGGGRGCGCGKLNIERCLFGNFEANFVFFLFCYMKQWGKIQ